MARDPVEELTELFAALSLEDHDQTGRIHNSFPSSQRHITLALSTTETSEKDQPKTSLATMPSNARIKKHQIVRKGPRRKKSLAQTISLSPVFIKQDAIGYFARYWKPTLIAWNTLLLETTIPHGISIADLNISAPVKALNNVMVAGEGSSLPPRFGYVQLARFLTELEDRIREGREQGLILSERRRLNASLAIDKYLEAQGTGLNALSTRQKLWDRKRIGRRWEALVGPSVLLLGIYSDLAESFVYDSSSLRPYYLKANRLCRKDHGKTDNPTFQALASITLNAIPVQLARVGAYLSEVAENARRLGVLWADSPIDDVGSCVASFLIK